MQKPSKSPSAIRHRTREKANDMSVLDASLSTSEALLHAADALEFIPIIGHAFKVAKAMDSVRDRLFAAKLIGFIRELGDMSAEDKVNVRARLVSDKHARRAAETLLLVLDRLTDFNKSELLARIFIAFAQEKIEATMLRRLCVAVDVAFADDLEEFLSAEVSLQPRTYLERLAPSGLTRVVLGPNRHSDGDIVFHTTEVGDQLFELVNGYPMPPGLLLPQ